MRKQDIVLGIVVTGARAGVRAGRLVLLPVRVATRTPLVGAMRRAGEGLASEGAAARARARRQLETAGSEALAGADLEDTVTSALEHERTQRYARRVLASPGLERLASEAAESRLTAQVADRLRLVGLGLAIVPLFAGFVPVLIDARRRGLHDFLAGHSRAPRRPCSADGHPGEPRRGALT
jgi:hypothetical protein